jgi:hypothetical protein
MQWTFSSLVQTFPSQALIQSVVPVSKQRMLTTWVMVLVPLRTSLLLQAILTVTGSMARVSLISHGQAFQARSVLQIS